MNTPNNKRKKNTQEKIQKAFMKMIQTKNVNDISVSEICKKATINRSTFYANYSDIYDLVNKIKERIMNDYVDAYKDEHEEQIQSLDFKDLFENIKENQMFYKTYFKLNMDIDTKLININTDNELLKYYKNKKYGEYHIAFFKAGLNAIIKKWIENDCKESPEEINKIIINEYKNKIK